MTRDEIVGLITSGDEGFVNEVADFLMANGFVEAREEALLEKKRQMLVAQKASLQDQLDSTQSQIDELENDDGGGDEG